MNVLCPGSASLRTPELSLKRCPACGAVIELFTNETSAACAACGFVVYRDVASCIRWCRHAERCVGEEAYRRLTAGADAKTD